MKRALTHGTRICQIVDGPDDEFPVHKDFIWVDVADDTVPYADSWIDGLIGNTDRHVPRFIEDIYDALDEDAQGRVDQVMRDRIVVKKTLRGQKP